MAHGQPYKLANKREKPQKPPKNAQKTQKMTLFNLKTSETK
jgi:hypothetical protein